NGRAEKRGFYCKSAIHGPARPAGVRGKMKEEAFAAGGCRGTFAPKACRSRRARQVATRRAIEHAPTLFEALVGGGIRPLSVRGCRGRSPDLRDSAGVRGVAPTCGTRRVSGA